MMTSEGLASGLPGFAPELGDHARHPEAIAVHALLAERERAQQIFETLLLPTSQWTVRWGEIAASASPSDPGNRGTITRG